MPVWPAGWRTRARTATVKLMRYRQNGAVLIALTLLGIAGCDNSRPPKVEQDYPLVRLTEHVFIVQAPDERPTPANQGLSNNPGFVVTGKGVIVIDPGSSEAVGTWLLGKIRSVTTEPVIAVINTHYEGDHWLANHAIKTAYPRAVIYAHASTRARMGGDTGHQWLRRINAATKGAARGTEITNPEFEFEHEEVLRLRQVRFRFYHADEEQAGTIVEIVDEGVLFISDNQLTDELKQRLGGALIKHIVPGHGVLRSPQQSTLAT